MTPNKREIASLLTINALEVAVAMMFMDLLATLHIGT
jgi:hypothetical protein